VEFERVFSRIQNGNDVRGAAIATEKEEMTITPDIAAYVADAFADYVAQQSGCGREELKIGVGRDSRITGPQMSEGCIRGLWGTQVFMCGLTSTPAMFQSTVLPESGFDAAIMITASHLPFNRSGMKFFTREGSLTKGALTGILKNAAQKAAEAGSVAVRNRGGKVCCTTALEGDAITTRLEGNATFEWWGSARFAGGVFDYSRERDTDEGERWNNFVMSLNR
jgi:phosphomannomutase